MSEGDSVQGECPTLGGELLRPPGSRKGDPCLENDVIEGAAAGTRRKSSWSRTAWIDKVRD